MADKLEIEETQALVKAFREELGDSKLSTIVLLTSEENKPKMIATFKNAAMEFWEQTGFKDVFPVPPEIEFDTTMRCRVVARPKNECALRIMQALNVMEPTHRTDEGGNLEKIEPRANPPSVDSNVQKGRRDHRANRVPPARK